MRIDFIFKERAQYLTQKTICPVLKEASKMQLAYVIARSKDLILLSAAVSV